MIAHSLQGDVFGPAQRLHGATYVVDAEFRRSALDADGIVIDIGAAAAALRAILGRISYRNLDAEPLFAGTNTTTERLARWVFDEVRAMIVDGRLGPAAAGIESLRVVLHESHVAWAAYEGHLYLERKS
jgi:6-pyruvoyl-tetrahydropterin synthase